MKAHDVRRLVVCGYCEAAGLDLLNTTGESRYRVWAHAVCLVEKDGFDKLAALPDIELAKITVDDFRAIGIKTLSDFNARVQQSRSIQQSISSGDRLCLAAKEFCRHDGDTPSSKQLFAAAKAYAFADVEQRIVKLLLEGYDIEDNSEDARFGKEGDKGLAAFIADHLKGDR